MQTTLYRSQVYNCVLRNAEKSDKESLLHGTKFSFDFRFEFNEDQQFQDALLDFIDVYLDETFDYTILVSRTDPKISYFYDLDSAELGDVRFMDGVSIESIAKMVYKDTAPIIEENSVNKIKLYSVSIYDDNRVAEFGV